MPMQMDTDNSKKEDENGSEKSEIDKDLDDMSLDDLEDMIDPENIGTIMNKGDVAFISQSGGIAFSHGMISQGSGYSFSKMVSLGNQIDLDLLDFLNFCKDDPDTKIISMYIENLKRDGNKFVQLLKEITPKKPVIIWKGGVGKTGHQAVMSHTGGLAGDYKMWESMAKQTGVILVDSFIELIDMIQTCVVYSVPKTLGTAVLSSSGGTAVDSTDTVERAGLLMPFISQKVIGKINEFIPEVNSNLKNPLEFGGKANMEQTINILKMLSEEPQFSSIIMATSPEYLVFRRGVSLDDYVKGIASAIPPESGKLLLCVTSSMTMFEQGVKMNIDFRSKAIPNGFVAYRSTEAAAKCCYRLWKYGQFLKKHK
jgi:acyl-CoA synthetase (NDP forming)